MSKNHPNTIIKRTRARKQVLQMLFSLDFVGENANLPADSTEVMDGVVVEKYAKELLSGISENFAQIDKVIEEASENWSLSRMASTDRAILRIAVFEMLYRDDVPSSVSINEAVELAQSFGGEDESFRFVNGVLGRIAAQLSKSDLMLLEEEEIIGVDEASVDETSVDEVSVGEASVDEVSEQESK